MASHECLVTNQTALVLHFLPVNREELAMADLLASLSKFCKTTHSQLCCMTEFALQRSMMRGSIPS